MELSELRLLEPQEILPGACKSAHFTLGRDGIERMEFMQGAIYFKVNGRAAAVLWIPTPGAVMIRDLNAAF